MGGTGLAKHENRIIFQGRTLSVSGGLLIQIRMVSQGEWPFSSLTLTSRDVCIFIIYNWVYFHLGFLPPGAVSSLSNWHFMEYQFILKLSPYSLKAVDKLYYSLLTHSTSSMTLKILNQDIYIQAKMLGFICLQVVQAVPIWGSIL